MKMEGSGEDTKKHIDQPDWISEQSDMADEQMEICNLTFSKMYAPGHWAWT